MSPSPVVAVTPVIENEVNAMITRSPRPLVAVKPVSDTVSTVPCPHGPDPHPPLPQPVAMHQTSLMMALVASAVGKMMVMSPAEADLSAPKLNTATALLDLELL